MKAAQARVKELDLGVARKALAFAGQVLPAEHYEPLRQVVEGYGDLLESLRAKRTSIRKLREMLFGETTERLRNLAGKAPGQAARRAKAKPRNHGRNGADDYPGAEQVVLRHPTLKHGDECPDCKRAKVYENKRPLVVMRFFGQQPIKAKVYRRPPLRCAGCGKVFCAPLPAEAQGEKYDATAVGIVALESYSLGTGFNRLEGFQACLGVPMPAATQWDLVNEGARKLEPVYQELLRQGAGADQFYNDDTPNRILELDQKKPAPGSPPEPAQAAPDLAGPGASGVGVSGPAPSVQTASLQTVTQRAAQDGPSAPTQPSAPAKPPEKPSKASKKKKTKRTGQYTTAIVAVLRGHPIGLFFTGRNHAGENLTEVLKLRVAGLPPPKQMCDGLDRNLPADFQTILGNCLAHGRRKFFDLFTHWPEECRYVLEGLAEVYRTDAQAKELGLSAQERLRLHQAQSGPVMARLKAWMDAQFLEKKVEPNSGLGKAIKYCRKRWEKLTLFLREAGAPLDNNIAERALKLTIRHRNNSLFFKTLRGAAVADLFMSLIHTCQLNEANPFEYLVALLRHAEELKASPADWMPWNYRQTLTGLALASGRTIQKADDGTG